ncbi:hypothetical protein GW17_00057925 [Ensete ventricosum]|nr:hypothetical protein GW17_00057925 [Ensete ventricosum]
MGSHPQRHKPPAGTIGYGQAPCKGRPPVGTAACKRVTSCGRCTSRKATYGQKHRPLPAASPQGAACSRRGRRGSPCPRPTRRGAAPTEASLMGTVLATRAAAGGQGQSSPAFSSFPLSKSCKIRLEEFRCRDPSCG